MTTHLTTWQQELTQAFSKPEDLLEYLGLQDENYCKEAKDDFSMRVPLGFAENMEKGNANDPLLRQVLPIANELDNPVAFLDDPVGDLSALVEDCIIHKYHGRVLLITTGSCAINCRFCFRRNFPYSEVQLSKLKEITALAYIQNNSSIQEVILSGGDPLLLSDQRLANLIKQIGAINHIKRIRIHSRLPIVLPARISPELLAIFKQSCASIILVTHSNHGNELSDQVSAACKALKLNNCTLLNQTVLLKDINDNVQALKSLSEKLFSCGVLPYYLHLLDRARGTAHFEVMQTEAIKLHQDLQHQLPGYLVPKLVQEQAGKAAKTLII